MVRSDRTPEWFNQIGQPTLPGYLGMRVTDVAEGMLRIELALRPEVMAPNGFLHGGTVIALADTAAGFATVAHMPEGADNFTTIELKANFLGTVRDGVVRAEARSVHQGRTTQVWDVTVYAEDPKKPLALFRCTQMILYPRAGSVSSPAAIAPAWRQAAS